VSARGIFGFIAVICAIDFLICIFIRQWLVGVICFIGLILFGLLTMVCSQNSNSRKVDSSSSSSYRNTESCGSRESYGGRGGCGCSGCRCAGASGAPS